MNELCIVRFVTERDYWPGKFNRARTTCSFYIFPSRTNDVLLRIAGGEEIRRNGRFGTGLSINRIVSNKHWVVWKAHSIFNSLFRNKFFDERFMKLFDK